MSNGNSTLIINSKKKDILSRSVSSIKIFKNKLGKYLSLALLRSYEPQKTHKEVSEPPGNDIE